MPTDPRKQQAREVAREIADKWESKFIGGKHTRAVFSAGLAADILAAFPPAPVAGPVARGVSPDILKLAAQAVAEQPQRKAESVDAWAERLAADMAELHDEPVAGPVDSEQRLREALERVRTLSSRGVLRNPNVVLDDIHAITRAALIGGEE